MEIVVSSQQMKRLDKMTIEHFGMPSLVLMERAALSVIAELKKHPIDLSLCLVVCGLGNNGGDGLAIARLLAQLGQKVDIVLPQKDGWLSQETQTQLNIVNQYGLPVYEEILDKPYTVVIDALFGIGVTRPLTDDFYTLVKKMNLISAFKVAVDIPSGISADNGQQLGIAFRADLTITFAFVKAGLLLYPGYACSGQVVVKDIGIDQKSFLNAKADMFTLTESDRVLIPQRNRHGNKGSFGKVLVVAGQKNMAGAAYLSGKAAAVTGCGLVKIFTVAANRVIIQSLLPEAIIDTWSADDQAAMDVSLTAALQWCDVVVAGPGLGTGEAAKEQVSLVLSQERVPVVLDADALNIVAQDIRLLRNCRAEVIITPHLGEMERLTGLKMDEIKADLIATARSAAKEFGVICVLKDARTVCALPDGTVYINQSGNSGMATAGAGDVLTGVIAGLLAQKCQPQLAAPLGVYLHGAAGDQQAERIGEYGLMAQDIIRGLKLI